MILLEYQLDQNKNEDFFYQWQLFRLSNKFSVHPSTSNKYDMTERVIGYASRETKCIQNHPLHMIKQLCHLAHLRSTNTVDITCVFYTSFEFFYQVMSLFTNSRDKRTESWGQNIRSPRKSKVFHSRISLYDGKLPISNYQALHG